MARVNLHGDLLGQVRAHRARQNLWEFRRFLHPRLIDGWWQREVSRELDAFQTRLLNGERPMMLIMAPPQHGKSVQVVDFAARLCAQHPDIRTIYASFSDRLGVRANRSIRRIFNSERFAQVMPDAGLGGLVNNEMIEWAGGDGYFRNTTVRGPITGEGLDLGILDDPIKGREEASSITIRDKTWEWLTDDFMSRFSDRAGLLGIMTRWHIDDPFGRLIEAMPDRVRVLRYPAIAEHDEPTRRDGEPLFPAHKPLDFLLERKQAMHEANWQALYQQSPTIIGGGIFKDEWWVFRDVLPPIEYRAIYADTAQKTKEQNDYSVFQCWGKTRNGDAILLDMVRGKWEAPELLERARAFWAKHAATEGQGTLRAFKIEDKVSGTGLIQTLKREKIPVLAIQRATDKITRAYDAAPYIENGNVILTRCSGLSDMLSEASSFPNGAYDDTLDPMMDAIADMIGANGRADYRIRSL